MLIETIDSYYKKVNIHIVLNSNFLFLIHSHWLFFLGVDINFLIEKKTGFPLGQAQRPLINSIVNSLHVYLSCHRSHVTSLLRRLTFSLGQVCTMKDKKLAYY